MATTTLLVAAPPADAIAAMAAIDGLDIASSILVTQRGPATDLGPEGAGAVLMLQATFADEAGAAAFWAAAVPLMDQLASAPGFIRRYSFPDGPCITLIALWRSLADAQAFGASAEHRAAVRNLYRDHWQYSHFSAIWELASGHGRVCFCPDCGSTTPAIERACSGCGATLLDGWATEQP